MAKNMHDNAFDIGTLLKLQLYKSYVCSWLPVFLQGNSSFKAIHIFDAFCGPGYDKVKQKGSPIILLEALNSYLQSGAIFKGNIKIFFNDRSESKVRDLEKVVANAFSFGDNVIIEYTSKLFSEIVPYLETSCKNDVASLLFADQYGINDVNEEIVVRLSKCARLDWLAFMASSVARRFREDINIKMPDAKYGGLKTAHRDLTDALKRSIDNDDYYLIPFSISKSGNVYGLIFGALHHLAADKFLEVCWKMDNVAGEANYSLDSGVPISAGQISLLPSRKIDLFKADLLTYLVTSPIKTNKDCFFFALRYGVHHSKLKEVLKKLKVEMRIVSVPGVSYTTIFRKKSIKEIVPLGVSNV